MKKLLTFMSAVTQRLQDSGNYGTAHVYKYSLNAVSTFIETEKLSFSKLTPEVIKSFEVYLRKKGCSWNTVSTYMRTFRAVYNRALDQGVATYVPNLFKHVYTGTRADCKRALEKEEMELIAKKSFSPHSHPNIERTRALFTLMFMLRGIPFVDLAYLRKSDFKGNSITYRRRKTGRILCVTILPEAAELIKQYADKDSCSPYLFSFVHSAEGTSEAYKEYQMALRHFNKQLGLLKEILGLSTELSSYTARHTWATTAYHCEVHPGIISEAMGHSSITVTETYLKPFRNKRIDDANTIVISYIGI